MANTQTLFIEVPIQLVSGNLISSESGTVIEEFVSQNSGDIPSSLVFSTDIDLNRLITFVDNRIVNASNDIILEYENNIIGETDFFVPDLQTTVFSDNSQVLPVIGVQSIQSTLLFGDDDPGELQLNLSIVDQGVASSLTIGTANVFVSIGPSSIESTITFGVPARQRPVHRSLIFKNDNITKLGVDDAVEVSSGVLFNPSNDLVTNNSIGFADLSIEVNQTQYFVPLVTSANNGQLVLQSDLEQYLQVANANFLTQDALDNYLQVANTNSFLQQSDVDQYVQVANVSSVGLSGSYNDLTNKPDLDQYLQVANASVLIQNSVDNYLEVANANILIQDKVDNYLQVANASVLIQDQVDNYLEVANTGLFVQRPELDSYLQVANLVNINSNIVPSANVTFDLGTTDKRWRDLYLSGNTIVLGNATISSNGGTIALPAGSKIGSEQLDNDHMVMALSDETTVQANTNSVLTFRAPFAMTLYQIPRASLSAASNTGSVTIDINQNGTSILGTKLTIDQDEKTSTTATSAATFANTSIADDAELTFDIDDAGIGAAGFKVTLYYRRA